MKDSGIDIDLLTNYSLRLILSNVGLTNGHLVEFFLLLLFFETPGNVRNLSCFSMRKTH